MTDIIGLSLILTKKCNAFCRHCGFSSGPDVDETMSEEDAEIYLNSASIFSSLKMISITGGEPLLYYQKVVNILTIAHDLGLTSELVTNCFWAKDEAVAYQYLKQLRGLGLEKIVTSLDDFHAEYISAFSVRNAVKAALELGLSVVIKVQEYPEAVITLDKARLLLGGLLGQGKIKFQHVRPMMEGRARAFLRPTRENTDLTANELEGKCDKIIRFPAIHPNGDVYPCCGFGEGCRSMGNVLKGGLTEKLLQMQSNLLFNLIAQIGPWEILKLMRDQINADVKFLFNSTCDICNYFYRNETAQTALAGLLRHLAASTRSYSSQHYNFRR